jgi:hypothetical protein
MSKIANGQSDQQTLRQEDVTARVSGAPHSNALDSGVLHDNALDAVTGGGRAVCTNNLKQIGLGIHN